MSSESGSGVILSDITTPAGAGGLLPSLLSGQPLPALAARVGARLAALWGCPVRFAGRVIVARHSQVVELLSRDLDFRIGPINAERIEAVNGPFVLGMDRDVILTRERAALYKALAKVSLGPIETAVTEEATARIDAANADIDVIAGYARPIAAHTAQRLFGIKGTDDAAFMEVARAIFAHTFLNVANDKAIENRALIAAGHMRSWFLEEIKRRRASGDLGSDMMGHLLRDGLLDDEGVRRTLGGMLVGSIDTTASSVAKIMSMMGKDRELAKRASADAGDPARLAGWCREALRLWPHNPILLRQATMATRLGDVDIRPGDQLIAWTQAAMRDISAFPEPGELRPDRPASAYLHFGGGLHPCAGRLVNGFQIPNLVGALLKRGVASVGRVRWAGPFPDRLTVKFVGASS